MEYYDQEANVKKEYKDKDTKYRFFADSEMNLTTPLWEKIVFFVIGFLLFRILGILTGILFNSMSDKELSSSLANFISYLILTIAFLCFLFFDQRKTYKKIFSGFTSPDTYLWGLIAFGLMIGIETIITSLYKSFIPFYGQNLNQTSIEQLALKYPYLLFFVIVIMAPFTEELTYRIGLVDTIGHKRKYRYLGILFSALIFGAIHSNIFDIVILMYTPNSGYELQQLQIALYNEFLNLPLYMISGAILALAYAKTGKLSTSLFAHSFNNLFSFAMIFIAPLIKQLTQ